MKSQKNIFNRYITALAPGELIWIGVRPSHKSEMEERLNVNAVKDLGLEGDHRMSKTKGSGRQVTIISQEYIQQIGHFLKRSSISPTLLRRNLVIKNINLSALRYQRFEIGEAIFEASAICHPCSRMELALGKGGVAAMMGHGGLCCKVLKSGVIKVGDTVKWLEQCSSESSN